MQVGGNKQHDMTVPHPQPALPPPSPPFQFSLRILLLQFVVLGSSLAVFGAWGIVGFPLLVGLAIYLQQVESLRSLASHALVVVCFIGLVYVLVVLLMPASGRAYEAPRRASCVNNLTDVVLALLNYHTEHGSFPPAYVADKNGKAMHSWRVLILPYLGHDDLYKAYDFTEPWDGPKNKGLLAACPKEYFCPNDANARAPGATQTSYLAVVGPNAAWAGEKPRKMGPVDFPGDREISNTIMVIEATNSDIPWTEPRDLSLDAHGVAVGKSPAVDLSSCHHGQHEEFFFTYDYYYGPRIHAAMADGSVQYLRTAGRSSEGMRKILQIGGCTKGEIDDPDPDTVVRRLNWPNIAALAVWLLSVGTLLTKAVRSRKMLSVPPPPAC